MIWSAATLAASMTGRFHSLLAARLVCGVGEAGYASGGVAWLSLCYPKQARSKVIGLFNAGIPLGSALGVLIGGALVTKTGDRRTPFYVFAVPGIILGLSALFLSDYATVRQPGEIGLSRAYISEMLHLFHIRSYILCALGFSAWLFVLFGSVSRLPALL